MRGEEIKNSASSRPVSDLNTLPFIDRILTKAHLYGEKGRYAAGS